ncbi:MAG: cryptochrome/photolyase family protein [Bacteroidia bacterium]
MKNAVNIFWFRRDLRLEDNAGLWHALQSDRPVLPIFIFDTDILGKLEDRDDARVSFIHGEIVRLDAELKAAGSGLYCVYGRPEEVFAKLCNVFDVETVFTNGDYEPYATARDTSIDAFLQEKGAKLLRFKDQVVFEKSEVVKDDGLPYTVFTPYSRKWKERLKTYGISSYPSQNCLQNLHKWSGDNIPSLEAMNFVQTSIVFPHKSVDESILNKYKEQRDLPAVAGTSRLSVHLRFGTISIRALVKKAMDLSSESWLNELIWRDFYHAIIWHFPHAATSAFRPAYDRIPWRNNTAEFKAWCEGKTGYPILDAGMRELAATGFMHNRVRMIVASFLTKHLLIDWRWGEAWFARKLLDFDLAANNGGWQWAAGSGCDAAPYFRVFNPALQTEKFDPKADYIRKWVPEFENPWTYTKPIVDHKMARDRAIATYKKGLEGGA